MKCEILKRDEILMLNIKPDLTKMKEIPISAECLELVRHGREGLNGLRLFIEPNLDGVLFVYDTEEGKYVLPLIGYCGCKWEDEMVDNVASSPIVDEGMMTATYCVNIAKIVSPEEFFNDYRNHYARVPKSTEKLKAFN